MMTIGQLKEAIKDLDDRCHILTPASFNYMFNFPDTFKDLDKAVYVEILDFDPTDEKFRGTLNGAVLLASLAPGFLVG